MQLYQGYRPLTARPFTAKEWPPIPPLAPWVRCFWGGTAEKASTLVIPDTCVDIIYSIDHASGTVRGQFCGIDDAPYHATLCPDNSLRSTFAIRFYAWTAVAFSAEPLTGLRNSAVPVEWYFPALHRALAPRLLDVRAMPARIALAESLLLETLRPERQNTLAAESIAALLQTHGTGDTAKLAREIHISTRQLERVLAEQTGASPKTLANLIRYQCLWRDILRPGFDVRDAVAKFGFTDQSHLQHTFKRYHGMTPRQARNVAFLQDAPFPNRYNGTKGVDAP